MNQTIRLHGTFNPAATLHSLSGRNAVLVLVVEEHQVADADGFLTNLRTHRFRVTEKDGTEILESGDFRPDPARYSYY